MTRQEEIDQVVDALRELISNQQGDPDPTHEDCHAWGYSLSEITMRLAIACGTLQRQISRYGDNRILRDDDGMDPAERTHRMRVILRNLAIELEHANVMARSYHSEASHLAVDVDPEATP